ncbi:MAG TPA: DUF3592 domain-containing protein [Gammaproteobacteria bacterium]
MDFSIILALASLTALMLLVLHRLLLLVRDQRSFDAWERVEATLDELTIRNPRRHLVADMRIVTVQFTYVFRGTTYHGRCLTIADLPPIPINQYTAAIYTPLQTIYDGNKRIHASVDPARPYRAVLREISLRWYIIYTAFMVICYAGAMSAMGLAGLPSMVRWEIAASAMGIYLILIAALLFCGNRSRSPSTATDNQ